MEPTIAVIEVKASDRRTVLASIKFEIRFEDFSVIIDEAKVLENRAGQVWLAMPSYSKPIQGSRTSYEYFPSVILSHRLKRAVEDAVLAAYEDWAKKQKSEVGR